MKFTTTTIIVIALLPSLASQALPALLSNQECALIRLLHWATLPLLRGAHATFEEQAAVASSTSILTTCEDPNCGGTAKEGEQCSLYCIEANTCNLTYESGGAFCCPNGYQPNNQLQCILNSACTFGPPSPPTPNLPSLPSPLASPTPSWVSEPTGSWSHGCPDGPWGGMSHDRGDAYDFAKTPATGSWACRPGNNPPQQILQSNLDKFKNGGEFQSIMIGGTMTTVHKTFGHSLDTAKQRCGECWIIKPVAAEGKCGTFGTCNLKDPENPPVILLMSVSEQKKDALHKTEISNSAFTDGLDAFKENDGCNDLIDGKWSFEYQPYENADLGCTAH
eukprot:scaffold2968_cov135-Skeletonema_dohrnii-CCMP3373.AAC.1